VTPDPRPLSAEKDLLARLAVFGRLLEAEWYNGNVDEGAYLRLNADLTGLVAVYVRPTLDAALAATPAPAPDEGPAMQRLRKRSLHATPAPALDVEALYRALLAVENHGAPIVPTDYLAIAAAYTEEARK
jgi:hypothetical protein